VLNKYKFLITAIVWTTLVTILSLVTIGDIGSSIPIAGKDKVVHFLFYFVFVIVWYYAKYQNSKPSYYLVIVAIVYGIFMEICQGLFTKNRMPDIFDTLANSAGAILAFVFLKNILNKKQI
jgi:VanZ family protein